MATTTLADRGAVPTAPTRTAPGAAPAVVPVAASVAATCVALDVAGPRADALARLVEGALGWQVVAVDDPVLPPRCRIADVAAGPSPSLPTVLVVAPDDDPVRAARAAAGAAAVLGSTPGPDELVAAVAGLAVAPDAAGPWRSVVASAGGVGCTTVAAALAGLRAWADGPTLLVAAGPAHAAAPPLLDAGDLVAPAAWAAAAPSQALPDLRVARWRTPPSAVPSVAAGPAVVVDLGAGAVATTDPVDVLVVRPDAAGLTAVERALGAPAVVVVGRGPVPGRRLRAAAPGVVVDVAWSARVAAAAAARRLPAALPGRWLRTLLPLVAAHPADAGTDVAGAGARVGGDVAVGGR